MDRNREIMSSAVIVVGADASVATCARRLLRHGIRHLPVTTENGDAIGMLTDFAVFRHGSLVGNDLELWVPFDVTQSDPVARDILLPIDIVVGPEDDAMRTLQSLANGKQDFAIVVHDDLLLGVITEHDGVRVAAEILENVPLTVATESSSPVHAVHGMAFGHEVLAQMQDLACRHMAVVDDEGGLKGIITYSDLLAEDVTQERHLRVDDVRRHGPLHTISADATLGEAAAILMKEHIGCLPVIDENRRPERIITRTDLIEAAVAAMEERRLFQVTPVPTS